MLKVQTWYNIIIHSKALGTNMYLTKFDTDTITGIYLSGNEWYLDTFDRGDVDLHEMIGNKSVMNTILKTFPMPEQYASIFQVKDGKFSKFYDENFK